MTVYSRRRKASQEAWKAISRGIIIPMSSLIPIPPAAAIASALLPLCRADVPAGIRPKTGGDAGR